MVAPRRSGKVSTGKKTSSLPVVRSERDVDRHTRITRRGRGRSLEIADAMTHVFAAGASESIFSDGNFSASGLLQSGTVSELLRKMCPKDRREQIRRAYFHYEKDDLLKDLVDLKIEFSIAGLGVQVQQRTTVKKRKEIDAALEFQQQMEDICEQFDLDKVTEDLLRDYYVTDNMILYWRIDDAAQEEGDLDSEDSTPDGYASPTLTGIPGVADISVLNPADVDWKNSFGSNVLYVAIPREVADQIRVVLRKSRSDIDSAAAQLAPLGIGRKWVEAVSRNENMVELSNDEGDYWLVCTRQRKNYGLSNPSMRTIFLPLEIRRMMSEGEYSAALIMKHFIMLLKSGESITTGPMAGSTKNYLKKKDADRINKEWAQFTKALRAAVNHTFKVEFVYPPKEMFDDAKYKNSETRIFNWSGITQAVFSGQSDNYGGGYLGIRRMAASISRGRTKVGGMWSKFFSHPTIAPRIKTPPNTWVTTKFDGNVLKEPVQLLDEVKFLFESGASDQRTSARELGRDPDSLRTSKMQTMAENKTLGVWKPVNEPARKPGGKVDKTVADKGGRPANPGTTKSEQTRTQKPTGRTTKNS